MGGSCHWDNGYGDGPESLKGNLRESRGLPISAGNLFIPYGTQHFLNPKGLHNVRRAPNSLADFGML